MTEVNSLKAVKKESKPRHEFSASLLYKLRMSKGFTMRDLAKKLKRSPSTIHHWESGKNVPTAMSIMRLCKIFDLRVDDFLTFTKEQS